ncbi:DUF4352 domain-containing protein [Nonomuraea sp. NPDC046802]|uniref:DUF4352 domain-containing protein n=1 Tax=Nonomuraea sp. NPDC046802 TaxID=3154919 RepID=UPI0034049377
MTQPYGQDPYRQQPPSQPYPPQHGYGYPPSQPPQRKKSSAPLILIIIGVVVLVLFGGCAVVVVALGSAGSGGRSTTAAIDDDQAEQKPVEEPAEAPVEEPAKQTKQAIGSKVRDGKFEFTVTKMERQARVGNDLLGTEAQGVFLLVHVTVENIGDEAQAFTSAAQKLHADGKEYEADSGAAIYLKNSKSLYEKINPGNSVQGVVLFDIPKDLKPETIELHDSIFSDGVRVSLS